MKLDWEINECRVLKAKVGETTYFVAPGVVGLWNPRKQTIAFDGRAATIWPVEGGMSLTNAIAWCERDVERPAKCPPQPIVPDSPAAETARKMSGKASKFPSTMDAKSWAVRLKMHNTPESLYSVSQLTEWFQAALSFGYEEGRKAGASRTMTASQYLACQQMNAAPPSPEAAPPRPEDPLQSFDARVWADEFMKRNNGLSEPFVSSHVQVDKDTMVGWFSNALMRGYDERRNVEAPFDEQRRQIEDSRRELVRDYRDLVARCMARIAELSEART
jgi:hypothetical protein